MVKATLCQWRTRNVAPDGSLSSVLEGLGEELADRAFEKARKDRDAASGVDHALVEAEIDLESRAGKPRGRAVIRPDDGVDKHPELRVGVGDALLEVPSGSVMGQTG